MTNREIDINFNFTSDTPNYWNNFWDRDDLLGSFNNDPDLSSKTLKQYHKILWSKTLPNGEYMNLEMGSSYNYLTWNNFRFGSDSITASFRYKKYRDMIEQVANHLPNYKQYMENYINKTYTIGGAIIFPKLQGGINQSRGWNNKICDRWDLTIECIRRYYIGIESPLYEVLVKNKPFFDLFQTFEGYINFFFLQDCVSDDYQTVKFLLGKGEFEQYPLPAAVAEYLAWIEKELDFVSKRNNRIH